MRVWEEEREGGNDVIILYSQKIKEIIYIRKHERRRRKNSGIMASVIPFTKVAEVLGVKPVLW